MIREHIFRTKSHDRFRQRATEILRVEALSDAVFAFSVSLLVASLEVPQTFHELKQIVRGAIPFFATVSVLFMLWYQQFVFFRHYGLNDKPTIIMNLAYVAIILFYVYPLKFLFSLLIGSWTGMNLFPKAIESGQAVISYGDFTWLVIIFSAGYTLIWLLLYLMHGRALKFSDTLQLTAYERAYTVKEKRGAWWNALVGLTAILFALFRLDIMAGICYLLIPALLYLNQYLFQKEMTNKKPITHAPSARSNDSL